MILSDRIVGWFSPEAALRRTQARLATYNLQAYYEGARTSRRTRGWQAYSTSGNAETDGALITLRNRARDLVRNNPFARAGLDLVVGYQVGTGIIARANTGETDLDRSITALWNTWAAEADITGLLGFDGMQAAAARARAQDGEALLVKVPVGGAEARRMKSGVPLRLQLLEADHLDETQDDMRAAGQGRVVQGVEIDSLGRRLAYHIRPDHPGDSGLFGYAGTVQRVEARHVIHLFRPERPGMVRGVTDLAPVITRIRALDELEDAALEQAKVQACLAAFVTSQAGAAKGPLEGTEAETGDARKTFAPGMIERLFPGEDVKFATPSGAGAFSDLARHQLHAIATGWGLTYDLLTGDLSGANYSSLRAGRLAFKRRLEQTQWLVLIPQLCQPVWDAFIEAAIRAGVLPPRADGYPVEWCPPAFEFVDPLKDAMGHRMLMRMGGETWGQFVGEVGRDPHRQVEEVAMWNAEFDRLGLIFDMDPRRTGNGGGAQDAAQNAAVEIGATGAAGSQ